MFKCRLDRVKSKEFALLAKCVALHLSLAGSLGAQDASRNITRDIKGQVIDSLGGPIAYAYVYVRGSDVSTISNSAGAFRLRSVFPEGDITIGARRIGYAPMETVIPNRASADLRIVLQGISTTLSTVEVSGRRNNYDEDLDRAGYYKRMSLGIGGAFITPEVIARRNPVLVTQLLENVSGIRLAVASSISSREMGGRTNFPLGRGGACAMGLVIDNVRFRYKAPSANDLQPRLRRSSSSPPPVHNSGGGVADSFDDMIPIGQVRAIEVYPSAHTVPTEFYRHVSDCGLVVVWTKYAGY